MMHDYSISPSGQPQQRSSPSSNSLSTSTPPQQQSRASPASTALVMSSNNISNNAQTSSRQVTPNGTSSNGGTCSSTDSNQATNQPPNPMMRQFACHPKSMSAGVVVSVPGISNNLAMNQNNIINNNIVNHPNYHQRSHMPIEMGANNMHRHHRTAQHKIHRHQTVKEEYHHHTNGSNQQTHVTTNGSQNYGQQAIGSSIVLSNNNIANHGYNRSASTHLSNIMLGSQNFNILQPQNQQVPAPRNFQPIDNSFWSIDNQHLSKSHGKLTGSGYMANSCMFNPSATDISCDNISSASRHIDSTMPLNYYLQHPHQTTSSKSANKLSSNNSLKIPEFLPICDLIFNLLSMILYFCEITFSIIALIALYSFNRYFALLGAAFVFFTNFICQYVSFKWLFRSKLEECRQKREAQEELEDEENYNRANIKKQSCGSCAWVADSATDVHLKFFGSILIDALYHILCLGFLMRYIKLVIPVTDDTRVKKDARDLCMLRMIHGFCLSAPILLLQSYVIASQPTLATITSSSLTSLVLSLLSICWAMASFTKYARKRYVYKFVLTWFGILCQLCWRLGTISSRVVALTIYAVHYGYWMLVILFAHWMAMLLLSLIDPGNLSKDEVGMPKIKKLRFAMASAWIYCFCYLNFEEHNSKIKMILFYLIQFVENNVLLIVSLISYNQISWFKNISIIVVYLGFVVGMFFMLIYYKYFHVSVLNNGNSSTTGSLDSIASQLSPAGKKIAGFKPGTLRLKSDDIIANNRYNKNIHVSLEGRSQQDINRTLRQNCNRDHEILAQSGVFNCNVNQAFNKKKKIPNNMIQ